MWCTPRFIKTDRYSCLNSINISHFSSKPFSFFSSSKSIMMRIWVLVSITISIFSCIASASPPFSSPQSNPFFDVFGSQCPLSFANVSPRQVEGDVVERVLRSKGTDVFTSVLIYATHCPFSRQARLDLEILSSIYPQVEHLVVEQSSTSPSLFSRYGIHGLPVLLITNRTYVVRHHGSKDLQSLILFYKKITGYKPVADVTCDKKETCSQIVANASNLESKRTYVMESWVGLSIREILKREPYLAFSVVFLCLSLVVNMSPKVLHHLRGIWASIGPHRNMEIIGGTSQMIGRVLQMINVKRVWTNLRRCKSRNLHHGARNARVWASSLTSVSLGETAPSR